MRANWSKPTRACNLSKVSHPSSSGRLQRAVMRQRPDLKCRCWDSQRSFWRAPDATPGGIPGFPPNCRDQLVEPALIPGSGCLWNHWALVVVESGRRSRTHLVWLQICEQLQAFDSWHAKQAYYGLHCLTRDFFPVQQRQAESEGTKLKGTVETIK